MLKAEHEDTDTSPKHIIPQKVQMIITQMQASNRLPRFRDVHKAHSMLTVMGGWMGCLQFP